MSVLSAKKPRLPEVKEFMTKMVFALQTETPVPAAAKLLTENKISSSPVINSEQKITGVISTRDCLDYLVNNVFHDQTQIKCVSDIMQKEVKCIIETADIFELEEFFRSNNLKHAPVIDRENNLAGMVSRTDALLAILELYNEVKEYKIERKKPVELNLHEKLSLGLSAINIAN